MREIKQSIYISERREMRANQDHNHCNMKKWITHFKRFNEPPPYLTLRIFPLNQPYLHIYGQWIRSLNMTMVEGPPASSSTPSSRTSVCYPSIRLLADMIRRPYWARICVAVVYIRHLFLVLLIFFYDVVCFFVSFVFLSVNSSGLLAVICMSYLSYPARWQVIALSTLLTALQFSISMSLFCDHSSACISLGGRISTDTGCAGCRRVERTV